MNKKFKIRKGDKVIIKTGRDKGKVGEVIEIITKTNRVKIQGANMLKKHRKPTQQNPGGIDQFEGSIHISNVAIVDPEKDVASRIGYRFVEGKKERFSKKSGKTLVV